MLGFYENSCNSQRLFTFFSQFCSLIVGFCLLWAKTSMRDMLRSYGRCTYYVLFCRYSLQYFVFAYVNRHGIKIKIHLHFVWRIYKFLNHDGSHMQATTRCESGENVSTNQVQNIHEKYVYFPSIQNIPSLNWRRQYT